MCAKNHIWRFKDKSKNVRWLHFFGPRCSRTEVDLKLIPGGHYSIHFSNLNMRISAFSSTTNFQSTFIHLYQFHVLPILL